MEKSQDKDYQDHVEKVEKRLRLARKEIAEMTCINEKAAEEIFAPPEWVIEKSKVEARYMGHASRYIREIRGIAYSASDEDFQLMAKHFLGNRYDPNVDYPNDLSACMSILKRLPENIGGNVAYLYWDGDTWICEMGRVCGFEVGIFGATPQEAILRSMVAGITINEIYYEQCEKAKKEYKKSMGNITEPRMETHD